MLGYIDRNAPEAPTLGKKSMNKLTHLAEYVCTNRSVISLSKRKILWRTGSMELFKKIKIDIVKF
jgi:hypothetical protein